MVDDSPPVSIFEALGAEAEEGILGLGGSDLEKIAELHANPVLLPDLISTVRSIVCCLMGLCILHLIIHSTVRGFVGAQSTGGNDSKQNRRTPSEQLQGNVSRHEWIARWDWHLSFPRYSS